MSAKPVHTTDRAVSELVEYFEGISRGTVVEHDEDTVVLGDLPYSGGAHMMPGSFDGLEAISEVEQNGIEVDTEYHEHPDGATHRDGRTKKRLHLTVETER